MASIHDIETKVNNDGMTPQGRLTAQDFNTLVKAVQELDKKNVLISAEEFGQLINPDESKIYFVFEE